MLQITGLHQSQGSSPWVLVWLVTNPVNPQGLCQRGWASFQRSQSSISSPTDPLGNPCPGTLWEILSFLVSTETLGSEPRASSFPPQLGMGRAERGQPFPRPLQRNSLISWGSPGCWGSGSHRCSSSAPHQVASITCARLSLDNDYALYNK